MPIPYREEAFHKYSSGVTEMATALLLAAVAEICANRDKADYLGTLVHQLLVRPKKKQELLRRQQQL